MNAILKDKLLVALLVICSVKGCAFYGAVFLFSEEGFN